MRTPYRARDFPLPQSALKASSLPAPGAGAHLDAGLPCAGHRPQARSILRSALRHPSFEERTGAALSALGANLRRIEARGAWVVRSATARAHPIPAAHPAKSTRGRRKTRRSGAPPPIASPGCRNAFFLNKNSMHDAYCQPDRADRPADDKLRILVLLQVVELLGIRGT